MTTLYLDLETRSKINLKTDGTHRYAEDPSTQIITAQWAFGDEDPHVADCLAEPTEPLKNMLLQAVDEEWEFVAHNSHFDRTILRHCWGVDVPVERWRDTMVKAMAHGLPGGLDKVCAILNVPLAEAKDAAGKDLIQLFCKPRPDGTWATQETHSEEWTKFLHYGRQDIVALRAIDRKLPDWNYRPGHPELALWHLDQRINDRGFQIDTALAERAIEVVAVEQARLKKDISRETDGAVGSASQRDVLLKYLLEEHGVSLPDMSASTLRRRMEDPELPEGVRILLAIRLESSKSSVAKYKAALRAVSLADGRLRNAIQFAGAQRTERWAGRLFQPQNMMRPNMTPTEIAIAVDALHAGVADLVFDDLMNVTANTVRGCIIAAAGKKLVAADLSNIEGRKLAFLAGEKWKLAAFAAFDQGEGHDLYRVAYGRALNVLPENTDDYQRQIGKVMELALGYQGGVGAFLTFAAVYGLDLDELADAVWATASKEALDNATGFLKWAREKKLPTYGLADRVYIACEVLKSAWRTAHPCTVALWDAAEEAVRAAVRAPGNTLSVGAKIRVRVDGKWLRCRLPSGRCVCYLDPQIDEKGAISYMGINQYTRQWARIGTYGGKLVENWTQAGARDVMAAAMPVAEAKGYPIVLTVHDELLTEVPDDEEHSAEGLSAILAAGTEWTVGLPLAAKGFECYRYGKH